MRIARRPLITGLVAFAGACAAPSANAQSYPNRPLRIIVPTPAGGPVDVMARLLANALPPLLGQNAIIENRAGAGNTLGSRVAVAADPDGYTLIVSAASGNGLAAAVQTVLPSGTTLPSPLGIAGISALLANLVNNLPAILTIAPAAAASGPGAVLAALIGVNVGPNLTYVGSLATLLWRRLLYVEDTDMHLGEYRRLGAATVPAAIAASTLMLWSGMKAGL